MYKQIIPATNIWAVYEEDEEGYFYLSPVIALGLTQEGNIKPIDFSWDCFFDSPRSARNFKRLIHGFSEKNLTNKKLSKKEIIEIFGEEAWIGGK